jgi:hypothetical protein
LRENKIHNQHDFGAVFDFVKYKAIFNKLKEEEEEESKVDIN